MPSVSGIMGAVAGFDESVQHVFLFSILVNCFKIIRIEIFLQLPINHDRDIHVIFMDVIPQPDFRNQREFAVILGKVAKVRVPADELTDAEIVRADNGRF